jgi:hypothetical protein
VREQLLPQNSAYIPIRSKFLYAVDRIIKAPRFNPNFCNLLLFTQETKKLFLYKIVYFLLSMNFPNFCPKHLTILKTLKTGQL